MSDREAKPGPLPFDPLHQLLEAEQEARTLVEEAKAQAKAIREEAERKRHERLAQAADEAQTAAKQARQRILEEADPVCRAKTEEAGRLAEGIKKGALPNVDAAVEAALDWLLMKGTRDDRRRTLR